MEEIMTKKIADLAEHFTPADSDVFLFGSGGYNSLRKISFLSIRKRLLSLIYPVGSVYESIQPTDPGDLFGGVWNRFGDGRVLVGVSNETEFNYVEKTGGEKTHALTTSEMPLHTHNIPPLSGTANSSGSHTHTATAEYNKDAAIGGKAARVAGGGEYRTTAPITLDRQGEHTHTVNTNQSETDSSGYGYAHNNMPPYITVYRWVRVA